MIEIYRHYAREADVRIADRFLTATEAALRRLASLPDLGQRTGFTHPALAGLGVASLAPRFKAYLIFYRPIAKGIEVIRVLHGARDIPAILANDFGVDEDAADEAEK